MGIYLPNMEMPKTGCYILSVDNTGKDKTIFTVAKHTQSGKIISCRVGEAVPVPPHGRLIDADAVQEEFKKFHDGKRLMLIDTAPTIIPASKSEEYPAFLPQYELTPQSEEGE